MSNLDKKYKELKQIFIFKLAGSKNIKTIDYIQKLLGLNNRTTRDLISKLKEEFPIISLSGSKDMNGLRGYFYFDGNKDDIKYLEHCQNEYRSRIRNYVNTINVLEIAKEKVLGKQKPTQLSFNFDSKKRKYKVEAA